MVKVMVSGTTWFWTALQVYSDGHSPTWREDRHHMSILLWRKNHRFLL